MSTDDVQTNSWSIEGSAYCMTIDRELLRKAVEVDLQEGDIVQVTFPKSGTHWVQQIIQLILHRGECPRNFEEFVLRAPFIEFHGEDAIKKLERPRTIRTHLPFHRVKFSENAKYVYVARNPWDCIVSFYKFMSDLPYYTLQGVPFDELLDAFLRGESGYGDYFKHVAEGYSRRNEPNVFFVTYEEFKEDTRGTILRLASFLGKEYVRPLEEDQALLSTVIEKSGTQYMRGVLKANRDEFAAFFVPNKELLKKLLDEASEKAAKLGNLEELKFVRVGKVGGWRETLTKDQLSKIERKIEMASKESDFIKLWPKEHEDVMVMLNA